MVGGRVQGVWFRDSTRREALARNCSGWVRNLVSGEVEAVFEGSPVAVDSMVTWSRKGPERALVTVVQTFTEEPEGLTGFEILAT
ncbi:MAG: acylphosphatase [Actinobacteria bacterium HGW-Actinobacteria-7]|nr:MAG: acylphosphatase [Actinobacteria bacterium HGW-Actinobacteria-7]